MIMIIIIVTIITIMNIISHLGKATLAGPRSQLPFVHLLFSIPAMTANMIYNIKMTLSSDYNNVIHFVTKHAMPLMATEITCADRDCQSR